MTSALHEAIVQLVREHPAELLALLARAGHPIEGEFLPGSDTVPLEPRNLSPDLVLITGAPKRVHSMILESQLRPDENKRRSWPLYIVGIKYHCGGGVSLVVVTLDDETAAWAAEPIETGHPGFVLRPIVLGPRDIPRITDREEASWAPTLAVLSALAHARDVPTVPIAEAALSTLGSFDEAQGRCYLEVIWDKLDEPAQKILEAIMNTETFKWVSPFALKHQELGRAEGRAEGKAEGKAEALLVILARFDVTVDDAERQRILMCTDEAILDRWIARAVHTAPGSSARSILADDRS